MLKLCQTCGKEAKYWQTIPKKGKVRYYFMFCESCWDNEYHNWVNPDGSIKIS